MVSALVPTASGSQRTSASPSRWPHSCASAIKPTASAIKPKVERKAIGAAPSQR
ncbi:MAG: hypothetical protein FD161_3668 [Limisphaerales bacterium]|nr:MAG: hypothetical protein FD161_3668 [Limisphaerales bacterium]